jgi:hypothetical protein
MFEVTEDNYQSFLTHHGLNHECCEYVIRQYDNTEAYHSLLGVKVWVEASKIALKKSVDQ